MKVFIHIFTIYMLALSLLPCSDSGGGIVEIGRHFLDIEHQHITTHDKHSNTCGDDACSPFCFCSCCSSTLDAPVVMPFRLKVPITTPEAISTAIPLIRTHSFNPSIWQPPRV